MRNEQKTSENQQGHAPLAGVGGSAVTSAANTINALSSFIHGISAEKRIDLVQIDWQNAKDQFEALKKLIDE